MFFTVVGGDKNRRGDEKSELPKQFSGLNEKKSKSISSDSNSSLSC
jgi:hypothetical protein